MYNCIIFRYSSLRKRVHTKGEIKSASGKAESRSNTGGIARLSNAAGADFCRPTVYTLSGTAIKKPK
jgi:hypothetical protein